MASNNIINEYLLNLYNNIFIINLINILLIIFPLLLSVAYFTLIERKIMAGIQRRKGPNIVGIFGLLQPFADGLKLLVKETIIPASANKILFLISPILVLILSLLNWGAMPFNIGIVIGDIKLSLLFTLAVSSLGVYGFLVAGWASNSKYAFLGALRAAAQMVSYEVSFGLIVMVIIIATNSFNFTDIVISQRFGIFFFCFFPNFLMFVITILAETNRTPFDLPEAEGELVAGYNVEYSGVGFAYFFIAEYANIILMSALLVNLFLGGWIAPFGLKGLIFESLLSIWFSFKLLIIIYFFCMVRAGLPRYRYDQLMTIGWKILLPLSLAFFIIYVAIFKNLEHVLLIKQII